MEQTLKVGAVSKDLERIKSGEATDLGVQDFFTQQSKSNRKISGLVEDSTKILEEEGNIKEELYNKSLDTNYLPDYIQPIFSGIFLTARRNKLTQNGLYLPTASFGKGSDTDMDVDFSDTQVVVACGVNVGQVTKGMEVVINMDNYKKRLESSLAQKLNKEFEFILPIVYIEGNEYLYVTERDIKYISDTRVDI
tara:strand:+ start:3579 stop:4160 length:582 start_codon:yes stop_codon:yes gene_type:complete